MCENSLGLGWVRLESSTTMNETLWQKPEPPWSPVTTVWVAYKRRGRTQTVAFFPTCTLAESRTSPAWAPRTAATTACLDARRRVSPSTLPDFLEVTSCHATCPYCSRFQTTSTPTMCPGGPPELLLLQEPRDLGINPLICKPVSK